MRKKSIGKPELRQPAATPDQRERFRNAVGGVLDSDSRNLHELLHQIDGRLRLIESDHYSFDGEERDLANSLSHEIESIQARLSRLQTGLEPQADSESPF